MATKNEEEQVFLIGKAAEYLKVSQQYLYQSRHQNKGPACEKREMTGLGRGPRSRIVYTKSSLDAWDAARKEKKKAKAPKPKKGRASQPKLKKAA
jgi:hypothetical protein